MAIKELINKTLSMTGYAIVHRKHFRPSDIYDDKDFINIYKKCKTYTMVSIERSFALYKAVEYISRNQMPGDFVECGVWRGGQAMIMALTLMKEKDITRKIWLYDTYRGMSKPTDVDIRIEDKEPAKTNWVIHKKKNYNEWYYASLGEVKNNMFSTDYPRDNIEFIEGKVEHTIPKRIPEIISLLRLDTDWYESTYHELMYLYPILGQKGVLLIDDYGHWDGCRKAVDDYFSKSSDQILLTRIDYTGRIGVKL